MNLQKLFKVQAELDKKIVKEKGLEGQDLLDKKILALQVELGELANEWRGFKFWKVNPKPSESTFKSCSDEEAEHYFCEICHRSYSVEKAVDISFQCCSEGDMKPMKHCNPLLEEYVDCLHFILSIGLELGMDEVADELDLKKFNFLTSNTILSCFIGLSYDIADFYYQRENGDMVPYLYEYILLEFAKLGKMLGFTWDEIERAYYAKNKENHERLENGY